ncbi:MAG: alpha/beta hydrolase [Actinomycetota bacterium]|nr:alpha/beta hydrolase [Actinomycetota bacterium]
MTLSELVRPALTRPVLVGGRAVLGGDVLGSDDGVATTAGGPVRLWDGPLPALPGADEPPLAPWPGERVPLADGRRIFVRTAPAAEEAEPALFVHGIGGSSLNWTDVTHLLGHALACEAMDLPGFGRSDPPRDGDYSLDAHAAAVIEVVEARGRGPVHLVGNSLGGAVSTRVAALRPDLVRTLTLVSPALPDLRVRRRGDSVAPLLLLPGIQRLARRRLQAQSPEARARATLDLCYYDISRVAPGRFAEAAEEVRYRSQLPWSTDSFSQSLRGLISAYLQRGPASLWRQAASVELPVLLIWGQHDRLVDVRLGERAQESFPDSRLLVLEDAGHVAQLESPESVARALLGRLDEVRERESAAA